MDCDRVYNPWFSPCFTVKFSWIFATCIQIQGVIKELKRRAKLCGFEMLPLSLLSSPNKMILNPYENQTILRVGDDPIRWDNSEIEKEIQKIESNNSSTPIDQVKKSISSEQIEVDEEKALDLIPIAQKKSSSHNIPENEKSSQLSKTNEIYFSGLDLAEIQYYENELSKKETKVAKSDDQ